MGGEDSNRLDLVVGCCATERCSTDLPCFFMDALMIMLVLGWKARGTDSRKPVKRKRLFSHFHARSDLAPCFMFPNAWR